jgi:glycosyltransferase involved in cell wall biosynthesis
MMLSSLFIIHYPNNCQKKENFMLTSQGISFIVPAYNEAEAICETLNKLYHVLSQQSLPYEIILVNDGSNDETQICAASVDNIKIIQHPVCIGYGNSIKTGIRASKFNWIGIIDADGSYSIDGLPLLLNEMIKGYDMVIASRANLNEIDSTPKKFFRGIFKKIIHVLNDKRIEDPNSGFRIFKKDLSLELMPFLCGNFSFTTSFTILASGLDYFISYVPLTYHKRVGKSKVRHLRDSIQALQLIIQGITFFNPLKYYIILSLLTIFFVAIPAFILGVFNFNLLSIVYLSTGIFSSIMIGIAGLGDIIRISAIKLQNKLL